MCVADVVNEEWLCGKESSPGSLCWRLHRSSVLFCNGTACCLSRRMFQKRESGVADVFFQRDRERQQAMLGFDKRSTFRYYSSRATCVM